MRLLQQTGAGGRTALYCQHVYAKSWAQLIVHPASPTVWRHVKIGGRLKPIQTSRPQWYLNNYSQGSGVDIKALRLRRNSLSQSSAQRLFDLSLKLDQTKPVAAYVVNQTVCMDPKQYAQKSEKFTSLVFRWQNPKRRAHSSDSTGALRSLQFSCGLCCLTYQHSMSASACCTFKTHFVWFFSVRVYLSDLCCWCLTLTSNCCWSN